ncbi:MAG: YicC family protein [Gammaproteobacteria bacterium]|nr:YicC family protein [Gammaproteobacteria bacterium]NIR97146.1 YicC family protein [Gammaproteobacteria bacterium]NIT62844.1 YicC family protein [Gammaproteobacteria bacterium]NIV19808.1 YicC family protein [Gammaproteobacteria bacterium]NIX11341.1 YicC family protein [Gammaproteobacteria bacterium]
MIRSMTAFARRERQGDWGVLSCELRSLNHRYLEVSMRLPEELRALEANVRERVARALSRGKVECSLRLQRGVAAHTRLSLDRELAQRLVAMAGEVDALHDRGGVVDPLDVLRWPGVVTEAELDLGPVAEAAALLLDEALAELVATREREGARLQQMLEQRCEALARTAQAVRAQLPEIRAALRRRLQERLAELDVQAEPGRLEQELALQLQKIDVDEELDRLQTHVDEVRSVLGRGEPVGRRLDFLMQELNREANTLGAKSAAAATSRASVELKVLIEQMREQVQNIE